MQHPTISSKRNNSLQLYLTPHPRRQSCPTRGSWCRATLSSKANLTCWALKISQISSCMSIKLSRYSSNCSSLGVQLASPRTLTSMRAWRECRMTKVLARNSRSESSCLTMSRFQRPWPTVVCYHQELKCTRWILRWWSKNLPQSTSKLNFIARAIWVLGNWWWSKLAPNARHRSNSLPCKHPRGSRDAIATTRLDRVSKRLQKLSYRKDASLTWGCRRLRCSPMPLNRKSSQHCRHSEKSSSIWATLERARSLIVDYRKVKAQCRRPSSLKQGCHSLEVSHQISSRGRWMVSLETTKWVWWIWWARKPCSIIRPRTSALSSLAVGKSSYRMSAVIPSRGKLARRWVRIHCSSRPWRFWINWTSKSSIKITRERKRTFRTSWWLRRQKMTKI